MITYNYERLHQIFVMVHDEKGIKQTLFTRRISEVVLTEIIP